MDKKISELNVAIELTDADVLPIVNGGETKKVTIEKLKELIPTKTSDLVNDGSNGTDSFITINDVPNPASYEVLTNKQNSLTADGTGLKYPTVDAVNAGIANVNTNAVDKITVKLGSAITKGQAVYVSSATGTNIVVSKASNLTEATSSKVIGLLETTGVLNDIVNVITYGLLEGLNTSTALIGDPVWLGSNGELIYGLANKPFAPAHLVSIGIVTRVNINNGEILVKIQNGFELKEIHDISAQNPSDKDIISYNFASKLWTNNTLTSILPQITITDTFVVANQVAMLAIVGETGDVAVRTDLSKTFILKGANPTVLADWQEILTPTGGAVASVFNRTGNVVATSGDYTADQITETATRKFQTANQNTFNDATSSIQTQLNGKAIDTNVVHLTGNETIVGVKTFTDIVGAGSGSLAGSLLNLNQTWNTTGNPTAIKLNVTNIASGTTSNLIDLQVATVSQFKVNKAGLLTANKLLAGTSTDVGSILNITGASLQNGNLFFAQPVPTALTASGTLTIAQMLTGIETVTSAVAVALTLPTGTLTDAGILGGLLPVNNAFEWTVINLGSSVGITTILAGTGHTIVGLATIPILSQATFRTTKTATNTFVTYRVY